MRNTINEFAGVTYTNFDIEDMRKYAAFQERTWLINISGMNFHDAAKIANESAALLTEDKALAHVDKYYAGGIAAFVGRLNDEWEPVSYVPANPVCHTENLVC